MKKYKTTALRRMKDQQLHNAPVADWPSVIDRAEQALCSLNSHREYRFGDLYHQVTTQPAPWSAEDRVKGSDALHDLRKFIEDVSDSLDLAPESAGEPVLTVDDVSKRFNVSVKTVDRWRDQGLPSRRYLFGKRKRIGFLKSAVERFARSHAAEVQRGARFSQLSDAERDEILRAARRLREAGASPSQVARQVAKEMGRSPETVRYTVKHHDAQHPENPIFGASNAPLREADRQTIFKSARAGVSAAELAKRFGRSKATIERIVNRMRAAAILERPIDYIPSPDFETPNAESVILGPEPASARVPATVRAPAGVPPYLASLYRIPLLSQEQEVYYFRKMNYLKFRAQKMKDRLNRKRPKTRQLKKIEKLLDEADRVKNLIIRRNLRLVVSVVKKYLRPGMNFFEMVSEGNVSLIRAVEKFDYSRGFKLSTYATWAITKNFARSIPAERQRQDRFRTGTDALFSAHRDEHTSQYEQETVNLGQREVLDEILERLDKRERDILVTRYGLDAGTEPQTLEQVGHVFGVTKERVRQLEARALAKLREIAEEEQLDIPGIR